VDRAVFAQGVGQRHKANVSDVKVSVISHYLKMFYCLLSVAVGSFF